MKSHGFSADLLNSKLHAGNIMALSIVITGISLQPCNPGFLAARDSIIAADGVIYEGENRCLIWKVFARRGLGQDADENNFGDGFAVSDDCI